MRIVLKSYENMYKELELSYFTLVCLWCGRARVPSRDYQNVSDA